jgi:hypothetical protein
MIIRSLVTIAFSLAASLAYAQGAVDQLSWMSGCWTVQRPDGMTEEHWMRPAGGTMVGMSRSVRAGKTTEYEFLQIRDVNGTLAYIAKPSGSAETLFPLKMIGHGEVVFENPDHDFPQRIIYRRGSSGITARIEGTVGGKLRGIDFPFARCSH